ncbi:major facilitator superfamily domain-containing protein [Leucosporidium creatinivorum]|uniref:Major facilitator superfamily domain-containing protein n=1 Tax=Leucosporidium creatinivorum TaxID=106004 RepID=A0A1Y2ELW3_9BASI|nr:major facilitator superfamily domain-containing protein [Leucosporidium creatinivorum]
MSLSTAEDLPVPPTTATTNTLVDHVLEIHPSPLEATQHEVDDDERTALLGGDGVSRGREREESLSRRSKLPWWKRPSPGWIMVPIFIFTMLNGAAVSVELEILSQVACRTVPVQEMPFIPPPPLSTLPFSSLTASSSLGSVEPVTAQDLPPLPSIPFRHFLGFRIAAPPDDEWASRCRKSPAAQKRTTEFMTKIMMIGGILAAASTGFWGGLSDRRGRVPLLAMATIGELFLAFGMILLVTYPEYLGMSFSYVGTALSGLLGGQMASIIVSSAYLSDCTSGGSRAQIFSLFEAVQYIGVAIGPILGSVAFRYTGLVLGPYYAIAVCRIFYLLLLLFVVPESLSLSQRYDERRRAKEAAVEGERARLIDEERWRKAGQSVAWQKTLRVLKKPLEALAPLAVVLPRKADSKREEEDRPLLAPRRTNSGREWNLTLVAIAFALYMIVPGITPVKIVYARGKFGWGPEETGYWITYASLCKLIMLLGILPFCIRALRKPPPSPTRARPLGEEGLITEEQESWDKEAAHLKLLADSIFDMGLARCSIILTLIAYLIMTLPTPHSLAPFLVGTLFVGLSAAATPALQSLALALSSPRDAGKVLASLSVFSTLAVQLVGPPVFGGVYVSVVDWWPELMFGVAAVWVALSIVPTFGVRLADEEVDEEEQRRRE